VPWWTLIGDVRPLDFWSVAEAHLAPLSTPTPIQLPIPDRFGHVRRPNVLTPFQVGHRPRHAKNAMHRPRGQLQPFHRIFQQLPVCGRQPAMLRHGRWALRLKPSQAERLRAVPQ